MTEQNTSSRINALKNFNQSYNNHNNTEKCRDMSVLYSINNRHREQRKYYEERNECKQYERYPRRNYNNEKNNTTNTQTFIDTKDEMHYPTLGTQNDENNHKDNFMNFKEKLLIKPIKNTSKQSNTIYFDCSDTSKTNNSNATTKMVFLEQNMYHTLYEKLLNQPKLIPNKKIKKVDKHGFITTGKQGHSYY